MKVREKEVKLEYPVDYVYKPWPWAEIDKKIREPQTSDTDSGDDRPRGSDISFDKVRLPSGIKKLRPEILRGGSR